MSIGPNSGVNDNARADHDTDSPEVKKGGPVDVIDTSLPRRLARMDFGSALDFASPSVPISKVVDGIVTDDVGEAIARRRATERLIQMIQPASLLSALEKYDWTLDDMIGVLAEIGRSEDVSPKARIESIRATMGIVTQILSYSGLVLKLQNQARASKTIKDVSNQGGEAAELVMKSTAILERIMEPPDIDPSKAEEHQGSFRISPVNPRVFDPYSVMPTKEEERDETSEDPGDPRDPGNPGNLGDAGT